MDDKTIKYLEAYQLAINEIDDYFEYRYKSNQDKEYVNKILEKLTKKLNNIQKLC